MVTTAIPQPTFGLRGFIAPPENEIMAGAWQDWLAAFGGNLNQELSTPQGQLVSSETAIVGDMYAQFVYLTQQVDPAYASGRMQDGIARIYFLTRHPATETLVDAVCSGGTGTVIPAGALAAATDDFLYAAISGGTIPAGGSITLAFACVSTGPIPCPALSLARIYQAIPGWDSIRNPTDGVLGNAVESRGDFEARRNATVARNARNTLSAVQGAVMGMLDVVDAYTTENDTAAAVTIGGKSVAARSLYVCVAGGTDQHVAEAIWSKKPPGCAYTGGTTVTVEDRQSGYVIPYPSYSVKFQRPTPITISFVVTLQTGPDIPSDAQAQVRAAVILAFSGADGGARARIGSEIFASRYYAPVAALGPWVRIVSLQIKKGAGSFGNTIQMNIDEIPVTAPGNITLTVV